MTPLRPTDYLNTPMGNIRRLVKRYRWLVVSLMLLGGIGGFVSVVLTAPVYQARTMLEVLGLNESFLKSNTIEAGVFDATQVNIQTQIELLRSRAFLERVFERLRTDAVPPPPVLSGFFSKLRARLYERARDPMQIMRDGAEMARRTFDARPVTNTRIIRISCDSTNPEIAAAFVNAVATEFIEQNLQSRMQNAQRTSQWLAAQLEESKLKMQDAERRLQDFIRKSGNLFAAQDGTLADSKLRQLQTELSAIQADRIAKQSRYELADKSAPEMLPEVLNDNTLRTHQDRIADLHRQLAAAKVTLMPGHYKVRQLETEIANLEGTLKREVEGARERIRNDYETALRREKLLSGAYSAQAGQVGGQAAKTAEYNSIRREVQILTQTYNAMLMQANQASVANSIPMSTIRLVEAAKAPPEPYRPLPALNLGLGVFAGLFLASAIAYSREKLDTSITRPGYARALLQIPELGVIPSMQQRGWRIPGMNARRLPAGGQPQDVTLSPVLAMDDRNGPSLPAESFRTTLASLMRGSAGESRPRVILVTSSGQGEGKTTVLTNLGLAMAETGLRIVMVDADLTRSTLTKQFGLQHSFGLAGILRDDTPVGAYTLTNLCAATQSRNLWVLPAGAAPPNISRSLYSSRVDALFTSLRAEFDMVMIDTRPTLLVADARVLARAADGVVLVIRAGVTGRDMLLECCHQFSEDGTVLLGTILNDWKSPGKDRSYEGYYAS